MHKPFAVIFDMDGVLIDSNPYHKIALRKFCSRYGYTLDDQQLLERIYGRTNRDWLTNLFGSLPEVKIQAYTHEKEAIFRELYKDAITPLPGLIPFLNAMDRNGITRAIGTSAPAENVTFTLSATGMTSYFPIILDESFVTRGKPDPEIYIKAAAALGMPNERCIVFEDSLSGVEAGKRAGSPVVGVATTHSAEELRETNYVIRDFSNLDPLFLESLLP
ncbi:MAG: HAD family phosphatase [Cyclobacteriaceae bacterium]|nr:HAD family phosphatase [Cytophagales bacterium]HNP75826.1 HAD family phosphatase [Cyclobacteriaceae bacterium]HQQ81809.1 HAD family phosphatase [Cyclobacteriaceae bacterium]